MTLALTLENHTTKINLLNLLNISITCSFGINLLSVRVKLATKEIFCIFLQFDLENDLETTLAPENHIIEIN